jgi:hypothetical protein
LCRRQVALIELDHGRATVEPPTTRHLGPGTKYGKDIALPRAYVFDVYRSAGGRHPVFNAHCFIEDQFDANVKDAGLTEAERTLLDKWEYLNPAKQWGGMIPDGGLVATWRMDRGGKSFTIPDRWEYRSAPAEPMAMEAAFDPASPRKFLRLHLPGQAGDRFFTGEAYVAPADKGRTDGWAYRRIHVARTTDADGAMFAAIWEPYAGEPTIKATSLEGNPADAREYAAIHIETVQGTNDLCFAGSGDELQTLADGTKVQARFPYISRDANGIRQAALVGGTMLDMGDITIKPATPRWEGKVLAVDYSNNTLTLDKPFPAKVLDGQFFEVGTPQNGTHTEHWTSYEAVRVVPVGGRTRLTWRKGADTFGGEITDIKADTPQPGATTVVTKFKPNVLAGENTQLVAALEDARSLAVGARFWRCDVSPVVRNFGEHLLNGELTLYDAPLLPDDVRLGQRICLYEFGPGSVWRAPTRVSVSRGPDGVCKLLANAPFEVSLRGLAEWSLDGKTWSRARPVGGSSLMSFAENQLGPPIYMRVVRE